MTFPHMGTAVLVLQDFFRRVDVDFVVPPNTSARTLQLGFRYSPEGACLPLKVTLGNMVEGLEQGADTLLMIGGSGPCRLGYYAEAQRRLLRQAGFDFEMIVFEGLSAGLFGFMTGCKRLAPRRSLWQIWKAIRIAFQKARVLDEFEKKVLETRAYERTRGEITRAWQEALGLLERAYSPEEIEAARRRGLALIGDVDLDHRKDVLRVGIVGEFYLLLEPFLKFDMEESLGEKGIYLERSIFTSSWMNPVNRHPVTGITHHQYEAAARPYLNHPVGGDGLATVGHSVIFARQGFDGLIHILPFTCMPEAVAKSVLRPVGRDYDIPILTFVIDEHTGKAGVTTRLEAFTDLLWARSRRRLASG